MADAEPLGDLANAVAGVLRGDGAALPDLAAAASRRARDRMRDTAGPSDRQAAAKIPAAVSQRIPQPAPAKAIDIRFANGRRVRAVIAPAVARRRDLAAVARASAVNDRRAFAALRRHRAAIRRLKQSNTELAAKVSTLQAQADATVVGVVQGFAGLQSQVSRVAQSTGATIAAGTAGAPASSAPSREMQPARQLRGAVQAQRVQAQQMRAMAVRAQVQNVSNVVNSVQAAAFGQKGSVFATNNLLLAGNQLFWTLLDPVLQRVGVLDAGTASIVAALSPLGTLLTGQILLADRQHVRFVTGVATFDGTSVSFVESLRGQISEQLFPEFQKRTDVPITTQVLDPAPNLRTVFAAVVNGSVRIVIFVRDVESDLPKVRVAWTVDAGSDIG